MLLLMMMVDSEASVRTVLAFCGVLDLGLILVIFPAWPDATPHHTRRVTDTEVFLVPARSFSSC